MACSSWRTPLLADPLRRSESSVVVLDRFVLRCSGGSRPTVWRPGERWPDMAGVDGDQKSKGYRQ
jgi:hypothetical protein